MELKVPTSLITEIGNGGNGFDSGDAVMADAWPMIRRCRLYQGRHDNIARPADIWGQYRQELVGGPPNLLLDLGEAYDGPGEGCGMTILRFREIIIIKKDIFPCKKGKPINL